MNEEKSDTAPHQPQPGDWQPTPKLRWVRSAVKVELAGFLVRRARLTLQQQWHIPHTTWSEWRDVPTVREKREKDDRWDGPLTEIESTGEEFIP